MFSTSWKTAGIFFVRANNDTANFITKLTFSGNEIVSFQLFSHFQTRFPDYSRQRKFFMQNFYAKFQAVACNWHNNLFWKFLILRLNFIFSFPFFFVIINKSVITYTILMLNVNSKYIIYYYKRNYFAFKK